MHRSAVAPPPRRLAVLVGRSPEIVAARAAVDRLAGSTSPVLVAGPAGSGKEVVAHLLHQRGTRAARPYVALSCGATPADRIAGELFGGDPARGTIGGEPVGGEPPGGGPVGTGAAAGSAAGGGRLGMAAGGTLFLDAVGDLPGDVQARLVRILDAGTARAGVAEAPVDVRIVAASAVDLRAAAGAGRFRADLLDRLAAAAIVLPPLAARRDDVPLLLDHFAATLGPGPRPGFTARAVDYLARQEWPGNVRQLRDVVARAAAIYAGRVIDEPLAAVLVHGERRRVDRWLATAPRPLPLPNRRRPPPIVAAGDADDVETLLAELDRAACRDALGAAAIGSAAARWLGLTLTAGATHSADPTNA